MVERVVLRDGVAEQSDWRGKWITLPEKKHAIPGPAIYLRNAFGIDGKVASARLYITARGVYIPYLNGKRVGQDRLTPGWTDYNIRIRYQSYDVTEQLQSGENAIGVVLGDGWYCGHMTWHDRQRLYGERPWLLAQLHMTLEDGTELLLATDETWKASNRWAGRGAELPAWRHDRYAQGVGLCIARIQGQGLEAVETKRARCREAYRAGRADGAEDQ